MAPEQVFGEKNLDRAVDIWALGVVWVECLSGQMLFDGDNFGQIFRKIALGERPPLEELLGGFPRPVVELIARMLSADPTKRPTDDEVLAGLRRHPSGGDAPRVPSTTPLDPPLSPMETTVARSFSPGPLPTVQHANLVTSLERRKPSSLGKWIALAAAVLTAGVVVGVSAFVRSWLAPKPDLPPSPAALVPSAPPSPSLVPLPAETVSAKPAALEEPDAGAPARPAKPKGAKSKDYFDQRF